MSEVRLVVRESERDWSGTIHGSSVESAIAALSADPMTLAELEDAVGRFEKPRPVGRFFGNLRPHLNDEPYDAGLVVIDLVARLVVVDSTYSSPSRCGAVAYHDGEHRTKIVLPYHLADDWFFTTDGQNWRGQAEIRRRDRAANPDLDARAVFYGRPLLEYLARECFAAFQRRAETEAAVRVKWIENARQRMASSAKISPDDVDPSLLTEDEIAPQAWEDEPWRGSPFNDTLKDIHAAWLLTSRDDLRGRCPREVALERHDHLTWDLQDRDQYWSLVGSAPRAISTESHAYRYGGFATHELVVYYSLVRELLWSGWCQLTELSQDPARAQQFESYLVSDFLMSEIPRLEAVRDAWLDSPNDEYRGRPPRDIIERERRRVPEVMSGHAAMIDCDCPLCQMMADMPGPVFWHLDGCNMDDEFAFDISHRTREEWDAKQREYEEFNRQFNAKWEECKRLGVTDSRPREDGTNAIWRSSFSIGETADVPLGIRVFGIGSHLAEVIVGLRDGADRESVPEESQRQIDELNRDFGNLRELLQSPNSSLSEALIDPVLSRFADTLSTVGVARVDLAEQCEALREELQTLLAPPAPTPDWDSDGLDYPF